MLFRGYNHCRRQRSTSFTSSQFSLINVYSLKNEYTEYHHQHSNAKKVYHPILMLHYTWWRHQMEIFFALPALCAGNSPVTGEPPSKRPVTRSLDLSYDLRLNKRLTKQSRRGCFETPSRPLWRHSKETFICDSCHINNYSLSQLIREMSLHATVRPEGSWT